MQGQEGRAVSTEDQHIPPRENISGKSLQAERNVTLCCFLAFPACCLPHWKHEPRPGGSFILLSGYSQFSRLARYTVSACLSMQCSSIPSPSRTTTSWDQAFLASVLVFYLQDNVSSSSLDLKKMAKSAKLSITGQAKPTELDSPRDTG